MKIPFRLALCFAVFGSSAGISFLRAIFGLSWFWLFSTLFFAFLTYLTWFMIRHEYKLHFMRYLMLRTGIGLITLGLGSSLFFILLKLSQQELAFSWENIRNVADIVGASDLSNRENVTVGVGVFLIIAWIFWDLASKREPPPLLEVDSESTDFTISNHDSKFSVSGTVKLSNNNPTNKLVHGVDLERSLLYAKQPLELFHGDAHLPIDQDEAFNCTAKSQCLLQAEGDVTLNWLGQRLATFPKTLHFLGLMTLELKLKSGYPSTIVRPQLRDSDVPSDEFEPLE